jgi:hypothetical protein
VIIIKILSEQSLRQVQSRFRPDGNDINQPKNKIPVYPSDLGGTSYDLFRKHPVIVKRIRRRMCNKTVRWRQKKDVNRTLENFYETPKTDPEKEKLQQELDELRPQSNADDFIKKFIAVSIAEPGTHAEK